MERQQGSVLRWHAATHAWNELLAARFAAAGYAAVRPSYSSVLLPLFEQDGLSMGRTSPPRAAEQADDDLNDRPRRNGLVERHRIPVKPAPR